MGNTYLSIWLCWVLVAACELLGLPWWLRGKESACQCRRHKFNPWVRKIPWRRKWQPTPVFLPGEFHGQRSLASYNPWGLRVKHDLATKPPPGKLLVVACGIVFPDQGLNPGSLSLGLSRHEHWSGLPFPSPGTLPDPGTEPMSPALAGGFFTTEPPGKPGTAVFFF